MVQEALLLDGVLGCICRTFGSVSGTFGGISSALGSIGSTLGGVSSRSGSISFRCFRRGCRSRGRSRGGCRGGSRRRSRFFAAGGQAKGQQSNNEEGAIHDGDYPSKVNEVQSKFGWHRAAENPESAVCNSHHAGANSTSVLGVKERSPRLIVIVR